VRSAAIVLYALAQLWLVAATARDRVFAGERGRATIFSAAWVVFGAVAVWRSILVDVPVEYTLVGLVAVSALVLLVTRGRPLLVMIDGLDNEQKTSDLVKRGRKAQIVLILGIVVIALVQEAII
jgi:hypothetical protein